MIKVCHGFGLNGGMRNRDWKYIWYHLDKIYKYKKIKNIIVIDPIKNHYLGSQGTNPIVLEYKEMDLGSLRT